MKQLMEDSTVGRWTSLGRTQQRLRAETDDSSGGEDLRGAMAGDEVVLFLVPTANHFRGAEACEAGGEQCQTERFGNNSTDCGVGPCRQEQDSRGKQEQRSC